MRKHPNPAGWLRLTLRNKLNHEFARRTTRSKHEVPETELAWLPAPGPGDGKTLDELLPRQLSQQDRELLKMAYEDGLTYQEMSQRLAIPPATCGTWLYRARQRCKQYLTQEKGGFYEKR